MIPFTPVWAVLRTLSPCLATVSLMLLILPSISHLAAAPAPPAISGLSDKTVNENKTTSITFTVSDTDTALSSVVVTASSSNTALIPNANLVPSGTTGSRALAVTPVTNSTGTSTVSVFATDGSFTVSSSFVLTVRAINDAPSFVLTTATVTATEDASASVPGVATSISTGGGNDESSQTVTFVVTPASAAFFAEQPFISASGTLKFRPALNTTGTTTISVKAVDDGGVANGGTNASPAQTLRIQINTVNDPPVLTGFANRSINEDFLTPISFTVTDVDSALASVVVSATSSMVGVVPNENLTPTQSGSGRTLTVRPLTNAIGPTTINVNAFDGTATTSTSFVLTVLSVNDAPTFTLTTTTVTASEDLPTTVPNFVTTSSTGGGVDESGQMLSFKVTPANAALFAVQPAINGSGQLDFTLAPNVTTSTTVSVQAIDNGGVANGGINSSAIQTFTIQVTPANDPPVLTGLADKSINEDTLGTVNFTLADVDASLASITITATSSVVGVVPNANLTPVASATANRTLSIRPLTDANGPTTITVSAYDGAATTSASFVLTVLSVNDAPSFVLTTTTVSATEDSPTTVPSFVTTYSTGGGADEAGQIVSFKLTPANPALFAVQPVINASRQLDFTLAPNVTGTTTVAVQALDNGGLAYGGANASSSQTFTIEVSALNDGPVLTGLADKTINEDATGTVAFKVADVDTALASLTVTASSSNAGLVPNLNLTPSGSSTNRTLTVLPLTHVNGKATITVNVYDGAATATEMFVLTVLSVNDAPSFSLTTTTVSVAEDSAMTIPNFVSTWSNGGGSDESSQELSYKLIPANPAFFALQPVINATRQLDFTLAPNVTGSTTVQVQALDNGGFANGGTNASPMQTFTVQVTSADDPPDLVGLANKTINEDTLGSVSFTIADLDTAGASVTITASSSNPMLVPNVNLIPGGSSTNRTLSIRPVTNANGPATITLSAADGTSTVSRNFVLTVLPVNDAPGFTLTTTTIVASEGVLTTVSNFVTTSSTGGASDESSQVLIYKLTAATPALFDRQPEVDASGILTFQLLPNQSAISTTVSMQALDSGGLANGGTNGSPTQTFTIQINRTNDGPLIAGLADKTINEDAAASTVAFTVFDVDTAVASITITASSSNPALVPDANLIPAGTTAARTLSVRPVTNANGTATITLTANDGSNTSAANFLLTVLAVNDLPSFTLTTTSVAAVEGNPTTVANFISTSSVGGGTDESGSQVLFYKLTPTAPALFDKQPVINASGTLSFQLLENLNLSSTTVSVQALDNGGVAYGGNNASASQTFTITITGANEPPVITGLASKSINEDTVGTVAFTVKDADTAIASVTITASSSNPGLVPNDNLVSSGTTAGRTLTVRPLTHVNGSATITVTANDGAATSSGVFVLTVLSVNDAPSFALTTTTVTVTEDSAITVPNFVSTWSNGGGTDENGQALIYKLTPANAAFFAAQPVIDASRQLELKLAPNVTGSTTVQVQALDNGGVANGGTNGSPSLIFTVQVTAVDDPPDLLGLANKTINEDSTGSVSFAVADVDTALASVTITPSSSNVAIVPNANLTPSGTSTNRTLAIRPVTNANGPVVVTLTANDGVNTLARNFVLTVLPVNDAPSFTLTTMTVAASEGVLTTVSNFVPTSSTGGGDDESAQVLTYKLTPATPALFDRQPEVDGAGALKFQLLKNLSATSTTVAMQALDSGGVANGGTNGSPTQTFTIQINRTNDGPLISGLANKTINEDAAATSIAFTVSDVDTAVASITVTASSSNPGLVPDGNLIPGGTTAARTLSVRPVTNANGTATITLTANDGINTSAANFVLTVLALNDPPSFTLTTTTVTATEGAPTTVPNFVPTSSVGGGSDEIGSQVVFYKLTPANPALFDKQPIINNVGALTFQMLENLPVASTTVSIQAEDNGGIAYGGKNTSAAQIFTIQMSGANDAPVISGLANKTINEDVVTTVAFSVKDADTGIASVGTTASSSNVGLVPNENLVISGTSTNRTLSVRPVTHANGSATITLIANDGATTSSSSFVLTVLSVNDAPSFVLSTTTVSASEGALTTVSNFAVSPSVGGGTDESTSQVVFYKLTPANPALFDKQPVINSSGTLSFQLLENLRLSSTTVGIQALDNGGVANGGTNGSPSQTFTIQVTGANDPPAILGLGAQSIKEDTVATVAFTVADVDSAVASVTITASSSNVALVPDLNLTPSGTSTNRTLSVRPLTHANGNATITVTASDGAASSSQMFVLTVLSVNDAPSFTLTTTTVVATEDTPTIVPNFVSTSSVGGGLDEASQILSYTLTPANAALFAVQPVINGSGQLDFTLAPNVAGSTTVSVKALDNGGFANGGTNGSPSQTITVQINGVPDAPVITGLANKTINEDATAAPMAFTVADVDTAQASLTVTASSSNPALVPNANLVLSGTTANRTLAVRPLTHANGNATITVNAYDGNATASSFFVLTVLSVNDAPTFTLTSTTIAGNEDAVTTIPNFVTTSSAGGGIDENGQVVVFKVVPLTPALFATQPVINSSGQLDFTLAPNVSGSTTITVQASDNGGSGNGGTGDSPLQTVTITTTGLNDTPALTGLADKIVNEDSVTSIAFTVADVDTAVGSITISASSSNSTVIPNANLVPGGNTASRTLAVRPATNASGNATITVNAYDGTGTTSSTFVLTVLPVNDAPTFTLTASTVTVTWNLGAQTVPNFVSAISEGPADEADQTVTFEVTPTVPSLFEVAPLITGAGALTFKTVAGLTGSTAISVIAVDDGGTSLGGTNKSSAQTFTLVISTSGSGVTLSNQQPGVGAGVRASLLGNRSTTAKLAAPARLLDGGMRLRVQGGAGVQYLIQASSDLNHWKTVGTVTGTGVDSEFIDSTAAQSDQRFYRIIEAKSLD